MLDVRTQLFQAAYREQSVLQALIPPSVPHVPNAAQPQTPQAPETLAQSGLLARAGLHLILKQLYLRAARDRSGPAVATPSTSSTKELSSKMRSA